MRIGIIDRYLFRSVALRLLGYAGIVVLILTLENLSRLAADVQWTDTPFRLLARLSLMLVPEHLSAAVPVSLLLAVMLAVRQLAMRGEWQIFAASGMSRGRILAGPIAVAALAAAFQLVDRFELRPGGERGLDALYHELRTGVHGFPLAVGEPVALDHETTLFVSSPPRGGQLDHVLIKRANQVFSAPQATISVGAKGAVMLDLADGTSVSVARDGSTSRLFFEHLIVIGQPMVIGLVGHDFRHRLDRLGVRGLWALAQAAPKPEERDAALAALTMRVESALFCLLLPWLGAALGVPAKRTQTAIGVGLGVVLIVVHLRSAAAVEDHFAHHAILAGFAHLALWTCLVGAICRYETRNGEGAIEGALLRLTGKLRKIGWPAGRRSRVLSTA